jgi:predicted nucleotidyltransferase
MSIETILKQFKSQIEPLYGNRLKKVMLFGSWARNEATNDSDIDVAVVLEGDVKAGHEIDSMIDTITDINLEYGVLLSVYPVSKNDYDNRKSPLLINLRKEGIPA